MLAVSETALVCDLAQAYGVLDWRALPVRLVAALAAGLGEGSRISRALGGPSASPELLLLAGAVDRLSTLVWMQTTDGQKGRNRPPSVLELLNGTAGRVVGFDTAEEFEAARARLLKEVGS